MADFEPWGPMLAEPRRKKSKYIAGVVQNRTIEGTYDFGLKLLQKMGWQKGKGLGKDCQGMTECIRLKSNSDRRGMCFEERMLDHQRDFNDLLTSLNSESGTLAMDVDKSGGLPSLEQKSKEAKRHIHYKKFARGKDLSRCTLNDFEGIMGKHAAKESLEVIGLLPKLQKCKQNVTSSDNQNACNKPESLKEDTDKPMVLNNDTDLCNESKTSILEKKKKKKEKRKKKERDFCEEPVRNQLNGTDGCDAEYSVNRKKRCDRYELVDDDCTTPSDVLCGRKRKECNEVNGKISYIKKKKAKLFSSKSLDNTVSVHKESTDNESSLLESTLSKDMCSEYRKKKKKKSREKVWLENGESEFDKSVVEESSCTPAPYGQPVSETNNLHDEKNRSDERQLCSNMEQTSRKHKKKHRKGNSTSFNEKCAANEVISDDSIDIVYEKIEQSKSSEPELLKQSKKKEKRKNGRTYIGLGDEGSGAERTAVSGYLKTNTAEINRSYENEEKVKLSAKRRKEKKMADTSLISIFNLISQVAKKENDRVILIESEDTGTEIVDVKKKRKKHKRRDRSLHCENGIGNSGENMITSASTPRCNDSKKSKKQKKQDCELGYKDTLGVQKVTYHEMSSGISETKHLKSKVQKETKHHKFCAESLSKTESKTRQTDVHEEPTYSEQCSSNHHRKARKISQDTDVISDVISGFVGANLKDIKGYGNWK